MKLVKLYSIFTFYLFLTFLIFLMLDSNYLLMLKENKFILVITIFTQLLLIIKVIYLCCFKNTVSSSIIIKQFILLSIFYYAFYFNNIFQVIIIIFTIFLIYIINRYHIKVMSYKDKYISYNLKIKNKYILNTAYIFYGIICYISFILSNNDYLKYFDKFEDAFLIVLFPYLIILLSLIFIQYDIKTDELNTNCKYSKDNVLKIIKRNIIINAVVILFFIMG